MYVGEVRLGSILMEALGRWGIVAENLGVDTGHRAVGYFWG